jgi:tetratricopeptide (TPR) repeat protein
MAPRVTPRRALAFFSLGLGILLARTPAAAQVAAGDSAWDAGRYAEARAAYEKALAQDSNSVRANYRLAVLLSWDAKHDSALVLLRRARAVEPDDPDLRFTEAQILSWQGRYPEAVLRYDSLLAEHPDRRDAALGRAQVLAWQDRFESADSGYAALVTRDPTDLAARAGQARVAAWRGDFPHAIERYQAILAQDPANAEALIGLAQVYHWQSRNRSARPLVEWVLARDSLNIEALRLRDQVVAGLRPQLEGDLGWSHDSDHNTNWWQTLSISKELRDALRGFLAVGLLEGNDPSRHGLRTQLEAGAYYGLGRGDLTAAAGLRLLSPSGGPDRTVGTFRLGGSYPVSLSTTLGLGYSHFPFDESAQLIATGPIADALDANVESRLPGRVSLSGAAGLAWLSDGNQRRSASLGMFKQLKHQVTVGGFGRILGYDFRGTGYFSPDRFLLLEARGTYLYTRGRWSARASAGLGLQQVAKGGDIQGAGHLEGRVTRSWSVLNEVGVFAGLTNSAASSTTGAFGYQTAGLFLRVGI